MKKSKFNEVLRSFARERLSPTPDERAFVSKAYDSIQAALGSGNCYQIGSYPRFTAITPLHDLDVLYVIGKWPENCNPEKALSDLEGLLRSSYKNPTKYRIEILRQTHSITISFLDGDDEFFSVDIVPACVYGKNEFGQDTYMVPELLVKSRAGRRLLYEQISKRGLAMTWIKSDPRGYIEVASQVNKANNDFRKSVKIVKGWRASCKEMDESFPLKAFHIEQVITNYFRRTAGLEIFDAIFRFFCELPALIQKSQIPDRADSTKNIDAYVDQLTDDERKKVLEARDHFLIKLENFSEESNPAELFQAGLHERASDSEAYLFDDQIPVLTEQPLSITANVLQRNGGFREKVLNALGLIDIDRRIEFRLSGVVPVADIFKWKVKNDNSSEQPRGEITDHHTLNDPEHTKYPGRHYVECFAIRNGVCVARGRQNVVLQPFYSLTSK